MGVVEIACAFFLGGGSGGRGGGVCWEIQMQKNGVTIKRRKSL